MPRISVIIPSYNDPRIVRTIRSLLTNEHSALFDLIVVDGNSSKDTIDQIKSELRTTDTLTSEKDKGIYDALNKGLEQSKNEFVYWLGTDDFINPLFDFEDALRHMESDDVAGFVARSYFFNSTGVTRPLYYRKYSLLKYKLGNHIPHFSSIWKRNVIGDLRFDLQYSISSDYDFFFKLLKINSNKRIIVSDNILAYIQEGGWSSKNFSTQLRGARQLFRIHRKHTNVLLAIYFILRRYSYKILKKKVFRKSMVPIVDHLSLITMHKTGS